MKALKMVRHFNGVLALLLLMQVSLTQAKDLAATGTPFVVEHTYWVKPGRSMQFVALYKRSELPKLDAWVAEGKLRGYRISQPQFTSGNDQWDYRVTLYWRDAAAAVEGSPLEIDRRKAEAGGRFEDQLMLELVIDHSEVVIRETEKATGTS